MLGHGLVPLSIDKLADRLKGRIDDGPKKLILKHLDLSSTVLWMRRSVILIKDLHKLFFFIIDDVSNKCPEVVLEVELMDLMLHLLQLPYYLLPYFEIEKGKHA